MAIRQCTILLLLLESTFFAISLQEVCQISNFCFNGGICVPKEDPIYFHCQCSAGYIGDRCKHSTKELVFSDNSKKTVLPDHNDSDFEHGYRDGFVDGFKTGYEMGYKRGVQDGSCPSTTRSVSSTTEVPTTTSDKTTTPSTSHARTELHTTLGDVTADHTATFATTETPVTLSDTTKSSINSSSTEETSPDQQTTTTRAEPTTEHATSTSGSDATLSKDTMSISDDTTESASAMSTTADQQTTKAASTIGYTTESPAHTTNRSAVSTESTTSTSLDSQTTDISTSITTELPCQQAFDIVVLLDVTKSITTDGFQTVVYFLKHFFDNFEVGQDEAETRVGFVAVSTTSKALAPLTAFNNTQQLDSLLTSLTYDGSNDGFDLTEPESIFASKLSASILKSRYDAKVMMITGKKLLPTSINGIASGTNYQFQLTSYSIKTADNLVTNVLQIICPMLF